MKELRWGWILKLWIAVAGSVFVAKVAWELGRDFTNKLAYAEENSLELLTIIVGISAIIFFATKVLKERT